MSLLEIDTQLRRGEPIQVRTETERRFVAALQECNSGDLDHGRQQLRSLLAGEDDDCVRLYLASAELRAGATAKALALLESITTPELLFSKLNTQAVCHFQQDQPGLAVPLLEQAHSLHPGDITVLRNLVQAHTRHGQKARAWEYLQLIPEQQMSTEELLLSVDLGVYLTHFVETVAFIERNRTRLPATPELAYSEVRALSGMNDTLRAERRVVDALIRFPNHPALLELAAESLYRNGRNDLALALLRAALPSVPKMALNNTLALSEYRAGNLDVAHHLLKDHFNHQVSGFSMPPELKMARHRLLHDVEQLRFLERTARLPKEHRTVLETFADMLDGMDGSSQLVRRGTREAKALERFERTRQAISEQVFEQVLGDHDWPDLIEAFRAQETPAMVIDEFLRPEALAQLRDFLLASEVWTRSAQNGYVGSFLFSGFFSRTLLQIARETELKLVDPLAPGASLAQAWAFQYDSGHKGINVHADFARINLNFWITPDEALTDPNSGGLRFYDVPVPDDWSYYDYNANTDKINGFLRDSNAGYIDIPHRQNRAMVFDPRYFHETHPLTFKPGYENRRINVTLLFGYQLQV